MIPQILLINYNSKRSSNPFELPPQHLPYSVNQHLLEYFHEFSSSETIFFELPQSLSPKSFSCHNKKSKETLIVSSNDRSVLSDAKSCKTQIMQSEGKGTMAIMKCKNLKGS